ncbi:MAG: cytochrome-c peroxidase [Chthoniobacteraceae bacterium]
MKIPLRIAVALIVVGCGTRLARAGDGIVDLTKLANYANQPIPAYIVRNNTPLNNPITDAGATLGRVLFYDKRLSRNDTVSCSSCHQQARAFGDLATASTGVSGTTGRHSMRLINARFATVARFFWDRRATSLESQTTQPIQDHVEMGFSGANGDPSFATLVSKLSAIAEYRVLFAMTFGDAAITEVRIQQALAQFVRSIQSFDSRFDVGLARVMETGGNVGTPFPNFTGQENAGKQLYLAPPPQGGAGCAGCHRAPEFDIDPNSLNNGVTGRIGGGTDLTNTRSPSLRDLVGPGGQSNGGFMHNGVFTTLAQVVNHYNVIPGDNANLDQRLRRPGGQVQNLNLTQQQRNELAAFLGTLTGNAVYTDARWSDPFNAQGALSLIVLPAGAVSIHSNGNGTATVACQAVPGFQYQLWSSPNLTNWSNVATVTPDTNGVCEHIVPLGGKLFYQYRFVPPAP